MRRRDKEINDRDEVLAILRRASVLRLAMVDGDWPYVVPMSFGGDGEVLYLHSAFAGRKVELLQRNDRVCFEVTEEAVLTRAERPCDWSFCYRSVIGTGRARLVRDDPEKSVGLDAIMTRHGGTGPFVYDSSTLLRTLVIRIDIETLTGKETRG